MQLHTHTHTHTHTQIIRAFVSARQRVLVCLEKPSLNMSRGKSGRGRARASGVDTQGDEDDEDGGDDMVQIKAFFCGCFVHQSLSLLAASSSTGLSLLARYDLLFKAGDGGLAYAALRRWRSLGSKTSLFGPKAFLCNILSEASSLSSSEKEEGKEEEKEVRRRLQQAGWRLGSSGTRMGAGAWRYCLSDLDEDTDTDTDQRQQAGAARPAQII